MPSDPREDLVPWYNRLNVVNLTFLVFLLAVGFPFLPWKGPDEI